MTSARLTRPARPDAGSLHGHVHDRLEDLAESLGLGPAGALLGRCHDLLLTDSCDYPAGERPRRRSTLNIDGTPVQLGLSLGADVSGLQFLGEVGKPELSNGERLAMSRYRLRQVAILLGVERSLAGIEPLVDVLEPPAARELLADHAGAVWLGAGCAQGGAPQVKVYCNAKWGEASGRWQRLRRVATWFGTERAWPKLRALENDGFQPLGTALRLATGSETAARIYLSGYGVTWKRLAGIGARFAGVGFEEQVGQLGAALLGDGCRWPARSVVCSFDVAAGRLMDVKVEICAHCAFGSDVEARASCLRWLGDDDDDAVSVYARALEILAPARMSHAAVTLHSYVGLDSRGQRTIYFNPRPTADADDDF